MNGENYLSAAPDPDWILPATTVATLESGGALNKPK
jgi:hypothetical protein